MANQTVYLVNPTAAAVEDVNAAGDDVPAYSMLACVLSDAEQGALAASDPKLLQIGQAASQEERRIASKILRLGKNPGSSTT